MDWGGKRTGLFFPSVTCEACLLEGKRSEREVLREEY